MGIGGKSDTASKEEPAQGYNNFGVVYYPGRFPRYIYLLGGVATTERSTWNLLRMESALPKRQEGVPKICTLSGTVGPVCRQQTGLSQH